MSNNHSHGTLDVLAASALLSVSSPLAEAINSQAATMLYGFFTSAMSSSVVIASISSFGISFLINNVIPRIPSYSLYINLIFPSAPKHKNQRTL